MVNQRVAHAEIRACGRGQVVGKMLHKPEMHEKGELRETGGRDAATGKARAPHD